MFALPEHPEIERCLRTGYPYQMQENDQVEEPDEDALYEEQREAEYGWE